MFARGLQIADEDGVDKGDEGVEAGSLPDRVFSFSGHGVCEGVAHLTAMDAELPGHPLDGPDTMLELASNLLK